jgi:hypothetical protein
MSPLFYNYYGFVTVIATAEQYWSAMNYQSSIVQTGKIGFSNSGNFLKKTFIYVWNMNWPKCLVESDAELINHSRPCLPSQQLDNIWLTLFGRIADGTLSTPIIARIIFHYR